MPPRLKWSWNNSVVLIGSIALSNWCLSKIDAGARCSAFILECASSAPSVLEPEIFYPSAGAFCAALQRSIGERSFCLRVSGAVAPSARFSKPCLPIPIRRLQHVGEDFKLRIHIAPDKIPGWISAAFNARQFASQRRGKSPGPHDTRRKAERTMITAASSISSLSSTTLPVLVRESAQNPGGPRHHFSAQVLDCRRAIRGTTRLNLQTRDPPPSTTGEFGRF